MNRESQLSYCKICKFKSFDPKKGIVCGYTGEYADFEDNCPDFEVDASQKAYQVSRKVNHNAWGDNKGVLISVLVFAITVLRAGCGLYSSNQREERISAEKQEMIDLFPETYSNEPKYKEKREAKANAFLKHFVQSRYPSLKLEIITEENAISLDNNMKIVPSKGEFRVLNTEEEVELYSVVTRRYEKFGILKFNDRGDVGLSQLKSFVKHNYGEETTLSFELGRTNDLWNYTIHRGESRVSCLGVFRKVREQECFIYYESNEMYSQRLLPVLKSFSQRIIP